MTLKINDTLKIMHIRSSPFLGSPERMIIDRMKMQKIDLCQYFIGIIDEQRNENNEFKSEIEKLNGYSYRIRPSMRHISYNCKLIRRKIKETDAQIICSHDYKSNFYSFIIKIICRIPAISVVHGNTRKDIKIRLYQIVDKIILMFFDAIICVSRDIKTKIQAVIPWSKCYVVPNAVDIKAIQKQSNKININEKLITEKKMVLFVGRLSKEKGLIYLINAIENIYSSLGSVIFIILGDGPERDKLEKTVQSKQLGDVIKFLGYKNNVFPYIKQSEFIVLPSIKEGMPVVLLEAFALKKTVIATTVGGIPEFVRNGYNGVLIPPKNITALKNAIEFLLNNNDVRRMYGENGYATVKNEHNIENQIKRYCMVYSRNLKYNKKIN